MSKMGLLLKVQLLNAFGFNKARYSKDPKERNKFTVFALLMIFVGIVMLFSITTYSAIFADQFKKAGALEFLPAMFMAAASLVTLFTTIYKVNGVLFGFKDYDMTMALPVKTEVIVAAKLLQLYLMNLGFCAFLTLPSGVVYAVYANAPARFYPMPLLLTVFIPLVPMILGTALGSLVTAISSRFRHTNLINLVLTMALVIAIMLVSFNMKGVITSAATIGAALMDTIYGIYPLTKMYMQALCEGNILSLIIFIFLSAALFILFSALIGKYYKRLNTALTTSHTASNYKMTSLKVSTPLNALYRRELRRYFSSPLYVLNTAIGMVLSLILSAGLLFVKPVQLEAILNIPGFAGVVGDLAPMVLAVFAAMTCTTACSISLEGKSLWVIKSLPVGTDILFSAKVLVNLTVAMPLSIVSSLFLALAIPMNPLQVLFLFITPLVYSDLIAEIGLYLNLLSPNFTWTSEVTVIKQSMPSVMSVLGGMVFVIASIVLLANIPVSFRFPGLIMDTVAVALADLVLYRLLKTKGARLFSAL